MSEKLQKVLARLGHGSRRGLEELISQGKITVNGQTAKLGDRIEDDVTVAIDGRVVMRPGESKVKCRVLMYHKPEGELTTLKDPEDRPTVFDHLPKSDAGRWIYVGRLDINTSGLLLFTTDGELANALMHPKHGIERVYAARVYGEVSEDNLEKLQQEVTLEDGPAHFDKVEFAGGEGRNLWFHCTLKEGRKREVRRLWEAVGAKVSRLIRIRYAGIDLDPKLKTGQFRDLSASEINRLRKLADLEPLKDDEIYEVKSADKSASSEGVKKSSSGGRRSSQSSGPWGHAQTRRERNERREQSFEREVFAHDKRNADKNGGGRFSKGSKGAPKRPARGNGARGHGRGFGGKRHP